MTYEILWAETKKDDWKVVTLKEVIEGGKTYEGVSINKVDKKQRSFPKFDDIAPGAMVAGNLWQSPTGKYTLFAPDEPRPPSNTPAATNGYIPQRPAAAGGMRGVAAAQERKSEGIAKAQDRKEAGIMVAAAMRDSTLIANTIMSSSPETFTTEDFQALFIRIKKWYLAEWNTTEQSFDVPF